MLPGTSFSDDLFRKDTPKDRKSCREKREVRRSHGLIRSKDKPVKDTKDGWKLSVSREELKQLQTEDETLVEVRKASQEGAVKRGKEFFWRDGLLYYRCHSGTDSQMDQKCRRAVSHLAHTVPTAGHLGRKKNYPQILLANSFQGCG